MLSWVAIEKNKKMYCLEMPHLLYYQFAVRSLIKSQQLNELIKKYQSENKLSSKEGTNLLYDQRQAMNCIPIFGALSLEAYINYYAQRYELPFQKDLDRLSTVKKWSVYSNWKTRKTIDKQAIDKIKNIFSLRDEFVHAKPELVEHGTSEPPKGKSIQGKIEILDKGQLIIDLNYVYEAIFKIDPDEEDLNKKNPWLCKIEKKS